MRSKVIATPNPGPSTPIVPVYQTDALHGLGNFGPLDLVPRDTSRWYRLYPRGWTSAGWFETAGNRIVDETCTDCDGDHSTIRYEQFDPDQHQTCDEVDPLGGVKWDYGLTPQITTPGKVIVMHPTHTCVRSSPPDGECDYADNVFDLGDVHNAGWPLVPFDMAAPSMRIRVVEDTSGPSGYEDLLAMEIDFSGSGGEGATFMGAGGGYADSGGANQGFGVGEQRSVTGWTIEEGQCWRVTYYVKAVPDFETGDVCTGHHMTTRYGFYPSFAPNVLAAGSRNLTLNGDWQLYDFSFLTVHDPVVGYPIDNAPLSILCSTGSGIDEGCSGVTYAAGRVHIKLAQVFPCGPSLVVKKQFNAPPP